MLASSARRILERLDDEDVVLDIGGWAKPFARADWVIDLMPYETRGLYGASTRGEERFDEQTWVRRDICSHEPYPFADREIDFVVCSHTLEDVRDPIWVCSEMNRIARAGYIEVPSRLEEQIHGLQGPWTGWSHHRWLIEVAEGRIEFVFKPGVVHGRASDRLPSWLELTSEERVETLWWDGAFDYEERVFMEPDELDRYLSKFVMKSLSGREAPPAASRLGTALRRLARR